MTPQDLVRTVEATGYTAAGPKPPAAEETAEPTDELNSLRTRLIVSGVGSLPVTATAMIPALQFVKWQWLSLTLAAPAIV